MTPRRYGRALLVDIHGAPIRIAALATETNYVFQYPFAATPCFLLKLGRRVTARRRTAPAGRRHLRMAGRRGPGAIVVAFSAICAHKLAYPTREVSFIRYQQDPSSTSTGNVIHCCADHSVYDPAEGARVVAGPAPQPLAAILLEHDAARDEIAALGTVGPEQFDAFFAKYETKLAFEYGGKARNAVPATTVVRELASYCKTTIRC